MIYEISTQLQNVKVAELEFIGNYDLRLHPKEYKYIRN